MAIKKFEEYSNADKTNEKARTELFGTNRRPSYILSKQDQDFYDYYTRGKFRGLSKYELNSEVFKLAQRKDEIGVLAQFCLQIERESIAADDYIVSALDELTPVNKIDLSDSDDGDLEDPIKPLATEEEVKKLESKKENLIKRFPLND